MKFSKTQIVAVFFATVLTLGAMPSHAQEPGRHPAYLHALSDLRLMRAYLDRLTPSERIDAESQHAIDEIDAAIHGIKLASIDDGRDLRDHVAVDARITPANRFRKAREAGNTAWAGVNHAEDNDFARGLKHRALDHIESANHIVDHIIRRVDGM
jgi:hypothetical protein